MKITFLVENQTAYANAKLCASEWGFSAFLETKGAHILFDTGHTDIYRRNAQRLGIDLEKTDYVVLSHHHWDHAKGLLNHPFTDKKKLIVHPHVLDKIPKEDLGRFTHDFEILSSEKPFEIVENVFFLGQIPRENTFEKGAHNGDPMLDDTAIAIKSKNGTIVLTGCSHSGICNICEYAKKVTGQKLYAVIGGFHLFEKDQAAVEGTINYFKTEKPPQLYPMHCVDFPIMARFHNEFGVKKLGAGDVIEFED